MDWASITIRCGKWVELDSRHLHILVSPQTHTIPHSTFNYTDIMRACWRPMRYPHERIGTLLSITGYYHGLVVVLDFLSGPLEQLGVHKGWEGPRRTTRGRGFVCGELKTDKRSVGLKQFLRPLGPFRP
jgi:hypothetical protein